MRQKPGPQARSATQVVKDIRRRTRKHHSSEEKIRIVLEGLRGEDSIAELAVLDRDYFAVPEDEIADITADLTLTGGKIVHAKAGFPALGPNPLPELPDWSPVPMFGAPGAPSLIR